MVCVGAISVVFAQNLAGCSRAGAAGAAVEPQWSAELYAAFLSLAPVVFRSVGGAVWVRMWVWVCLLRIHRLPGDTWEAFVRRRARQVSVDVQHRRGFGEQALLYYARYIGHVARHEDTWTVTMLNC